jgi:hypothetical protein
MSLFSHKPEPAERPAVDRGRPHDYVAPNLPANRERVSCQVCGQPPDDILHMIVLPAAEPECQPEIRWSD